MVVGSSSTAAKAGGGAFITSPQSTAALRRLFQWIEARYGGIPMDSNATILSRDDGCLETADLQRLFRHEITALHVREFYPRAAAQQWGRELELEARSTAGQLRNWRVSTSRGLESSDVHTLGTPFNVAAASRATLEEYFAVGVPQEFRRRRFDDDASTRQPKPLYPLDLLRLRLDEVWPAGAGLAREQQQHNDSEQQQQSRRPCSGGLPRIMKGPTRWKQGFVHVDEMAPLHPQRGLFSANIYLQLPAAAAATTKNEEDEEEQQQDILQIWPTAISSRWDWYRNALLLSGLASQDAEAQVRLRHELGPPQVVAGRPGDLILLCAQRPHAAVGFSGETSTRVSLQCFVQHRGPDQRLLIDA